MRTTLNIDDPILKEVKTLRQKEGKSLGQIVSGLLADGLRVRRSARKQPRLSRWTARAMKPRVDLGDKEAVYAAMERDASWPEARRS